MPPVEEEEAEPPLPPPEPPEIPEIVERDPERDTPRGPSTPLPLYGGFGGGGFLYFGATPSFLTGWLVYARLGLDRGSAWSPQLIVSYMAATRGGFDNRFGSTEFHLRAVALDVCPWQLVQGPLAFNPCVYGEYGRLNAEGSNTGRALDPSSKWGVAGAKLQLVSTLSVVELRLAASAGATLHRDSFQFAPPPNAMPGEANELVHDVPPLVFSTSIGAGLSFH